MHVEASFISTPAPRFRHRCPVLFQMRWWTRRSQSSLSGPGTGSTTAGQERSTSTPIFPSTYSRLCPSGSCATRAMWTISTWWTAHCISQSRCPSNGADPLDVVRAPVENCLIVRGSWTHVPPSSTLGCHSPRELWVPGGSQVSRPPKTQGGVPIRVRLPSLRPKRKRACRKPFILKTKTEGLREDVGEVAQLPTSGRTPTLPSITASASPPVHCPARPECGHAGM